MFTLLINAKKKKKKESVVAPSTHANKQWRNGGRKVACLKAFPLALTQAQRDDLRQGSTVSVGPIWQGHRHALSTPHLQGRNWQKTQYLCLIRWNSLYKKVFWPNFTNILTKFRKCFDEVLKIIWQNFEKIWLNF